MSKSSKEKICNICANTFTKTTRKPITCPHCAEECCMECFRMYLNNSLSDQPDCMSCRKTLTLDFVAGCTPKVFHNKEYREKRNDHLFNTEQARLPETQERVTRVIRTRRYGEEILLMQKEEKRIMAELKRVRERIQNLRTEMYTMDEYGFVKTKKTFIMACPDENCKGFLSTAWKCELCEKHACSKCRQIKKLGEPDEDGKREFDHTCNEDDVKTASLISKDCKNCPKCAVPIYRSAGCPQMWCTNCETAFDWNSGQIVTKNIHNPHYFEWQRNQAEGGAIPRVAGDNPGRDNECDRIPTFYEVSSAIKNKNFSDKDLLMKMFSTMQHIRHLEITAINTDYSCLRVKYLLNELTIDQWKKKLMERSKKNEKRKEINDLLNVTVSVLTEEFIRIIHDKNIYSMQSAMVNGEQIRKYTNKYLELIGKRYGHKYMSINHKWELLGSRHIRYPRQ